MLDFIKNKLLMIEPSFPASEEEVRDEIVFKLEAALQHAERPMAFMGKHKCICGKESDCYFWLLYGYETNSLALHYLLDHRSEVPETEIFKILDLPDPNNKEIYIRKNEETLQEATEAAMYEFLQEKRMNETVEEILKEKL